MRGCAVSRACSLFAQDDKTVLHALVQCPSISYLGVYVEHLSRVGRSWLSTKSIVKITPLPSFNRVEKAVFICLMTRVK